jgi:hypothetical protein
MYASNDARAMGLLESAHAALLAQAAQIADLRCLITVRSGGLGPQSPLPGPQIEDSSDRSGSLAEIRRSSRRAGKPTSSRSSIRRARSVTMVLCAREDAPPFSLCARSACGASTAKRRVALPANLAEGRPRPHDRIVMPFHECATSHPRLPISSVSEMAAPGRGWGEAGKRYWIREP